MERPQDAIRRRWPDVRCITRLRRDGVELEFSKTSDPYSLVRKLQRPSNTLAHDAEVQALERLVDLEHYFRWLAFNSLVENADSRNELFIFELPTDSGEGRLDLLPWDYDDLQEPPARPLQVLTEPLFYASEMRLDRRIHENPKLRERYQRELRRLLEEDLTADVLTDTLADVARRLQRLEGARVTDQQERAHAMMGFEQRLLERRTELLDLVRPAQ